MGDQESSLQVLRKKDLCKILGISRTGLEGLINKGILPKPKAFSQRFKFWPKDEFYAWFKEYQK